MSWGRVLTTQMPTPALFPRPLLQPGLDASEPVCIEKCPLSSQLQMKEVDLSLEAQPPTAGLSALRLKLVEQRPGCDLPAAPLVPGALRGVYGSS